MYNGKVFLIVGPMFSGKTKYLVKIIYKNLKTVYVIKSNFDTRDKKIISHCRKYYYDQDISVNHLHQYILENADKLRQLLSKKVICIDEAQFVIN